MFKHTHLYTVHVKPASGDAPEDIIFVREGFNFWAFLFTVFWAVFHRTWLFALVCLAWGLLLSLAGNAQIMSAFSLGVLQLGISVIFGYMANDELRESLTRRGYTQQFMTSGENKIRAEQRFFDYYATTLNPS